MKKSKIYLKGFLITNIMWLLSVVIFSKTQIPNSIAVYVSFKMFFRENMILDIFITLYRIIAGITIALVLGSITGYFMAASKKINMLLDPLVVLFYPIPKAVLLPVVYILFGTHESSIILIIALIGLFQIILSARDTVINIGSESIDYLLSLGASKKQLFRDIIIPEIVSGIVGNIKNKIRTSFSVLFFCETFGASKGLGCYVTSAWYQKDFISMFKGILVVCILSIFLYYLAELAEERFVKPGRIISTKTVHIFNSFG